MSEQLAWFKSTYSGGDGGNCVEVATTLRTVHIRDSKRPVSDPYLTVPSAAWSALVAYAREA
ncbi:DUF397 domain-containing protein [Streptomyces sp. HNM0574]|uniref:DUF397 domain-containing protein n=1 Tax=Streptomyces sp. HNM0574 TaxID=2714954 RepID=UPI00146C75C1|nr:DUF397 domain-containing protein [Streptomyces sp. HNM0574]NLU69577.1 DUF397 domain-containing protein [Streptomyces sp. HNM0574]